MQKQTAWDDDDDYLPKKMQEHEHEQEQEQEQGDAQEEPEWADEELPEMMMPEAEQLVDVTCGKGARAAPPLSLREKGWIYNITAFMACNVSMTTGKRRDGDTPLHHLGALLGVSYRTVCRCVRQGDTAECLDDAFDEPHPSGRPCGARAVADAGLRELHSYTLRKFIFKCNDETKPVSIPMMIRHMKELYPNVDFKRKQVRKYLIRAGFRFGRGSSKRVDFHKGAVVNVKYRHKYLEKLAKYVCPHTNLPLRPVAVSDESFCARLGHIRGRVV